MRHGGSGERNVGAAVVARWGSVATVAALSLALVVGTGATAAPEPVAGPADGPSSGAAAATAPVRILTVGDSITQGTDGDRTWRWFAWREWRRQGTSVDLVGPRRAPKTFPGQKVASRYTDPNFDTDHAGLWGDRIAVDPLQDATSLVATQRPDVVVLELGTNDFRWTNATPATVLAAVEAWVAAARAARPGVEMVLVEVIAPVTASTATYNAELRKLATRLSTADSRVAVARTTVGMRPATSASSGGDTYDDLHPNARGEAKYAAAVVDAVAGVGFGRKNVRPLQLVPEGPRTRVKIRKVSGGPRSVNVWWKLPPGATGSDIWVRRPGKAWKRRIANTSYDARAITGLRNCRTYEVKVGTRRWWTKADRKRHSKPRRVVAGGRVNGVVGVQGVRAAGGKVKLSWAADGSACSYRVRATLQLADGSSVVRSATVRGPRATLHGLSGAGRLMVTVTAVGKKGAGPRSPSVWIV